MVQIASSSAESVAEHTARFRAASLLPSRRPAPTPSRAAASNASTVSASAAIGGAACARASFEGGRSVKSSMAIHSRRAERPPKKSLACSTPSAAAIIRACAAINEP